MEFCNYFLKNENIYPDSIVSMSSQLIYKVVKEQTKIIGEKMHKLVKFLRLYLKYLFLLTVLILNLNHALQKLVNNYTILQSHFFC